MGRSSGALPAQGDRDHRGTPDARPHQHAAGDSAEVQRIARDGLPEGEELANAPKTRDERRFLESAKNGKTDIKVGKDAA